MSDVYRYRSDLSNPAHIAPIAMDVEPGQEFDSWEPLNHPHLTPLNKAAKDWQKELERQRVEYEAPAPVVEDLKE